MRRGSAIAAQANGWLWQQGAGSMNVENEALNHRIQAFRDYITANAPKLAMTNDLLELNNLYIEMETANITVNASYLFLKNESFTEYRQESANIGQVIERIKTGGRGNLASREVVDILYTAQTYLEQSDELVALLQQYVSSPQKREDQYSRITEMYNHVQETMYLCAFCDQSVVFR